MGNERLISFWHDIWVSECPLRVRFPGLYAICSDLDIKVADCLVNEIWDIQFVRNFGKDDESQWGIHKSQLEGVELIGEMDRMV